MRASRLLTILLLLRTRDQVGAEELAGILEVSVRTVYRDIDALSAAGVPVYGTRGPAGGYRLLDTFRASVSALTGDEAQALGFAGLPAAAGDLGLGAVLSGAQLKLLDALPAAVRERVGSVRDKFLLDAPGWEQRTSTPEHLPTVAQALWDGTALSVRYQRAGSGGRVRRDLLPLGLVLKAGVWYLVAAPLKHGTGRDGVVHDAPRTYRVSRLLAVTARPDRPEPPPDFDLTRFWADYQDDYETRLYKANATIRLSPEAWSMRFLLGRTPARAARDNAEAPDADGWRRTTVPIESEQHALHSFLQLGAGLEVVEPDSLRARVAAEAGALRLVYS